jgi:hypothetical protein
VPASARKLRRDLKKLGLSDPAISAAWPGWWSEEAENSPSARAELRFSLARKLGLDPRSLLEDEEPRFIWRWETRFKQLTSETDSELAAITAFGTAIARALVAGTTSGSSIKALTAHQLRAGILANQPYVRLVDLIALCWAVGIPVIHLRIFPLSAKRMCAMTTCIGTRPAILLGKDAEYPAPIAYYLAHEMGHIALGHLNAGGSVVDLQDPLAADRSADRDEWEADRFALELLSGKPEFVVDTRTRRYTARELANSVLEIAPHIHVEPGTLALCFGHTTQQWNKAHAAMRLIYTQRKPVWSEVNAIAAEQLDWSAISKDMVAFTQAVMGEVAAGGSRG